MVNSAPAFDKAMAYNHELLTLYKAAKLKEARYLP